MAEREAFAPRQTYAEGVYSSTKWQANQQMCMHHELSYTLNFPGTMMFACLVAPPQGGATVVADSPTVLNSLPRPLVDRFAREGWMLTRTYGEEIGADWTAAFGTDNRATVEHYCRANGIEFAWQPDGGLRTRQRRSAIVRHPVTGQPCWFNQIAFLNQWTLAEDVREYLVDDQLIYTGPIDEFFDHRYGALPYRSLEFRHETLDQAWFQPTGTVNYPSEDVPYTRISEYKHMTGQAHAKTTVTYEYPKAEGDPYYPVPRPENQALYKKYEALALQTPDVHFVGRLATYRYYNMDQVAGQALATYRKIVEREGRAAAAEAEAGDARAVG
jgi:hypothetical protein